MSPWLSIIGIGEDGPDGLSPVARRLIEAAELVVGGKRHLLLAAPLVRGDTLAWRSPIEATYPDIVARRGRPVAVLASGDPFHYGIGGTLAGQLDPPLDPGEMISLPHLSSVTLAANRLCWPLQDVSIVALNGRRVENLGRWLHDRARLLVLASDGETAAILARLLTEKGFGGSTLHLLESLGGREEKHRRCLASDGVGQTAPLTIIGIDCVAGPDARAIPLAPGLPDDWFDHDGQLTKRELRALALSALRPEPGQLLWDVGAGAGSIAIEWLLRHRSMRAIAFERHPERTTRIALNAARLGTPDLVTVEGRAPDCFDGQPAPDAVFIGGGTSDPALIERAWLALSSGGTIVAHAVTLEGSETLSAAARQFGGDLVRFSIERMAKVGRFSAMKPAMPVMHWAARK